MRFKIKAELKDMHGDTEFHLPPLSYTCMYYDLVPGWKIFSLYLKH